LLPTASCLLTALFPYALCRARSTIPARHASKAGERNLKSAIFNLPLSPFQFVAKNGEVVFLARLYQKERPISLLNADYIARLQIASHLSITGQGDIGCLSTNPDFNMGVTWQNYGTIGQRE